VPTIWTVGHSTLTLEAFLERVKDVDVVADIRRFPTSKRHPHFSGESIAAVKPYRWFEALGGRRSGAGERHPALRNKAFRAYAAHMETGPFLGALADLEALARERRTALLCAEAVWFRCHRMLLSDLLTARGWTVLHLPGAKPHRLTKGARPTSDGVVYDGAAPEQGTLWG
jgi:uncharacterized protein (DUF488 family)